MRYEALDGQWEAFAGPYVIMITEEKENVFNCYIEDENDAPLLDEWAPSFEEAKKLVEKTLKELAEEHAEEAIEILKDVNRPSFCKCSLGEMHHVCNLKKGEVDECTECNHDASCHPRLVDDDFCQQFNEFKGDRDGVPVGEAINWIQDMQDQ